MLGDCIFTPCRRQALPFPQNRFRHLTRHLTPLFAKKTLVSYIEQNLTPPSPPESNVDHGHDECKERAKKKLEFAEPPLTQLLNIRRGGAGGPQPTVLDYMCSSVFFANTGTLTVFV